ncbi:hypothetical protein C2S53_010955 [Perilla frutescens var. hirtella]|uniref:N-acetyltransferase n=1 Tax=Perilla frutescens var. hirtella TaxID=608512 RepID=A0AAD4JFS9_PERFH|nr:hypothetical protein C2S53_010955 [Perilla frutescens var. hirtella]
MAPRRRNSSPPSSAPISIGNCEVIVQAKNFTSESNRDSVQISLSKTAQIRISVVEKANERDHGGGGGPEKSGNCYFVLANPKDSTGQTKSLLQEVLTLYMKELPAMNFAANTGKESMFLQRCVTNGKYCTLLLKSKDERQPGEVIAAITYQIVPADTQYAEVPLAAVNSVFQRKGIGRLLFLELRERLQSVGVQTILCWGDKESEGFWIRQGFTVIGEVAKNGRPRKLPIKADIRKALCFPGGSTLMSLHLLQDSSSESAELPTLCLPTKPIQLYFGNQELMHVAKGHGPYENNQIVESGYFKSDILGTEEFPVDGCQDVGLVPAAMICSVPDTSGKLEGGSKDDEYNLSCSMQGTKKRMWETSWTSLMSKKVKGTHSGDHQSHSHSPHWTSDVGVANSVDRICSSTMRNKLLLDASPENFGSNNMHGKVELTVNNITNEDHGSPEIPFATNCYRIMLMNIADADKKSRLTKIIEDLGGVVASDGSVSTHVVTGKVRKTLNFCTALCSGAWVISSGWLKESFKKGRFVDETPFILNDEDYKTKYRTELKSAVVRAKASPGTLLKGLDIWLATHVQPPINTLSAIVKSAGGNVIRTQKEIRDVSITIFVACEEDMEEAVSALKLGIQTFSSDWVMNCIMKQELDLEAPQFVESL